MKTISVSLILMALLSGESLQAQTPERKRLPQEGDERPAKNFQRMWEEADKDGDDSLAPEEFFSLPRLQMIEEEKRTRIFQRLDKNADGAIDRREMHAGRQPGQEGHQKMLRLWALDQDANGKIDRAEFNQGEFVRKIPQERQDKLFARLDTNGDGMISREDQPKLGDGKRPQRPLNPGDGPNPPPKGKREPRVEGGKTQGFPRAFDTSKDGTLDFEEFAKIPAFREWDEDRQEDAFETMDANRDLKVTPDEWKPAMR